MMKRSGRLGGGGVTATVRTARGEGWPGRIWNGSAVEAGAEGVCVCDDVAGLGWAVPGAAPPKDGLLCVVAAAGGGGSWAAGGLLLIPVTGAGAGRTVVVGGVVAVAGVVVLGE